MVSVAQEKRFCLRFTDSEIHRSQIQPNFIPQSVIKPDMEIELRMEGAVNGHQFVIEGKGSGKPFE